MTIRFKLKSDVDDGGGIMNKPSRPKTDLSAALQTTPVAVVEQQAKLHFLHTDPDSFISN